MFIEPFFVNCKKGNFNVTERTESWSPFTKLRRHGGIQKYICIKESSESVHGARWLFLSLFFPLRYKCVSEANFLGQRKKPIYCSSCSCPACPFMVTLALDSLVFLFQSTWNFMTHTHTHTHTPLDCECLGKTFFYGWRRKEVAWNGWPVEFHCSCLCKSWWGAVQEQSQEHGLPNYDTSFVNKLPHTHFDERKTARWLIMNLPHDAKQAGFSRGCLQIVYSGWLAMCLWSWSQHVGISLRPSLVSEYRSISLFHWTRM